MPFSFLQRPVKKHLTLPTVRNVQARPVRCSSLGGDGLIIVLFLLNDVVHSLSGIMSNWVIISTLLVNLVYYIVDDLNPSIPPVVTSSRQPVGSTVGIPKKQTGKFLIIQY